ncbi:MAG: hypothetical protein M1838_002601 [Thelocarpon superellum]|nr:MAG: hypothetical protein M1838_002601 [Thelocarpon superellum]
MKLHPIYTAALSALLASPGSAESKASSALLLPHTATLYAWPLSAATPSPFLTVRYDPRTHESALSNYSPPPLPLPPLPAAEPNEPTHDSAQVSLDDIATPQLTRVGLYSPATKKWSGVATDATAFAPGELRTVTLHLDEAGEAWRVGFEASLSTEPAAQGKKDERAPVVVRLATPTPGPTPHVNKPVLVDAEGRQPFVEPERSLFQKYWWVLVGVAVLALAGGGGDK